MEQAVWELLGIAPTNQKREIRKAYAAQVKKCHVEDSPEEFERLHQAYLRAMELSQGVMAETLNNGLESLEREEASLFPTDLSSGADWEKTSPFPVELSHKTDERKEPSILEQLFQRKEKLEDTDSLEQLRETLSLQMMDELDNGEWDVESFNREYAFSCFERLCKKCKDGGLYIFEPEEWGNLIYQARDAYYSDAPEAEEWRGEPVKIAEPHGKTLIQLQKYLIQRYDISEEICLELWENFEVTGRMAGYHMESYEPVLLEMQKKYPKLMEQKAGRIILWKRDLLLLAQKWQYGGWMGQRPERLTDMTLTKSLPEISRDEWQETQQLLKQEIFEKEQFHTPMLQWLAENWTAGVVSPALTKQLYEIYQEYSDNPLVKNLQEVLMQQLSWYQKLSDQICQETAYVMPEPELIALAGEQNFWENFFATVIPFSTGDRERDAGNGLPYLSAYFKKCCRPSLRWWKKFTGYEEKSGQTRRSSIIIDCKELLEQEEEKAKIQVTFALHHIEYRMIRQNADGEHVQNIFYKILPFEQLCRLGQSPEEIGQFFLLLPIAIIEEGRTQQACQEILARLKELPLYDAALAYLASCLVHQTDWENLPQKPQKIIEDVYYSETGRYCFRGVLTPRKFTLALKTPDGWEDMKLQNGESKKIRAIEDPVERREQMHRIVDEIQPPLPECIQVIPLAQKTQREKAEAVFEALIQKRRGNGRSGHWETRTVFPKMQKFLDRWDNFRLGTDGTVLLRFGEGEESVTLQSYMFASSEWNMNGLLVPIRGEKRYAYRKREARLQKRVEESFLVCGYFALEWALPIPYGVGKSGTFYSYYDHKLHRADDFEGLIAEYIDLSPLKQIEIYKGYRTVSNFTGELEYYFYHWYDREDQEVYYNYPYERMREISQEI